MKKGNRAKIIGRYLFIALLMTIFSAVVISKLVDTTIVCAEEWNRKASEELARTEVIRPERGNILASDGSVLATNLRFYTVRMDYRSERFKEDTLHKYIDTLSRCMAAKFPVRTASEWRSHLLAPLAKPRNERPRSYKLLNNISNADLQELRTFPFFNQPNRNRSGLTWEIRMRRVNPYGDMARRSIGGVGATAADPDIHGISGLEMALDSLLYGRPGLSKKIALTKGIVNWTDRAARPGYDIRTTIDINMQDIVENELNNVLEYVNADWGVAVLMEVATGDIKAISNLERNPHGPGFIEGMNRAVLGFEPGSVVKTLSMMIALEDGIVTSPNRVLSTGHSWAYAGGRPITDSHGVGSLTVSEVIERSSNIGMAKIITSKYEKNPGEFYTRLKRLGFLDALGTGIAGERGPRIDSVPSDRGGRIALSRMSYGYATEIPPLHTLSIYNAIANGGRYVRPRLVAGISNSEGLDSVMPVTYVRERACSEKNAALLRDMLRQVVWGEHGTARRLRDTNVAIAGKTGTCYMIENGSYNTSKKRLAFCGFFPAESPKYSCIVLTANPKQNAFGAASTSGEVLKGVALKLFSRGMLDNSSDFKGEGTPDATPTLYATAERSRQSKVRSRLDIKGKKRTLSHPDAVKAGVPDVRGYGLRDAINALERAGYRVSFSGAGYVAGQNPSPGTRIGRGNKVMLHLTE